MDGIPAKTAKNGNFLSERQAKTAAALLKICRGCLYRFIVYKGDQKYEYKI